MCAFNVLSIPDHILTVQYAVDFLKGILINQSAPIPTLNEVCRNYPTYEYFEPSICTLSALLVALDARSEECCKIYELLLSFCSVPELRQPVCSAILKALPPPKRSTRPTQAVVRTAKMNADEALLPEVPIHALKLLNFLVKEAIEDSDLNNYFENADFLVSVVDCNAKTSIETASEFSIYQCQRISEGLKLAQSKYCC
jgi:hypothetical protein